MPGSGPANSAGVSGATLLSTEIVITTDMTVAAPDYIVFCTGLRIRIGFNKIGWIQIRINFQRLDQDTGLQKNITCRIMICIDIWIQILQNGFGFALDSVPGFQNKASKKKFYLSKENVQKSSTPVS